MEIGHDFNAISPTPPLARAVTEFRIPFGGPLRLLEIEPREARWDVLAVLAAPIGLIYFPSLFKWFVGEWIGSAPLQEVEINEQWIAASKLFEMLLAIGVATYFIFRNGVRPQSFGIRFGRIGQQLLWSVAAFVSAYAYLLGTAIILGPLLYYFYGPEGLERGIPEKQRMMENIGSISVPWLVATLIAVGIHEELLFRGMLLTLMRRATGSWWIAIVGSSAIFGSLHFHQGWLSMLQITGLGIVLSLIFVASRSLLAVAIAHFFFNFCQIQIIHLLQWWMERFAEPENLKAIGLGQV